MIGKFEKLQFSGFSSSNDGQSKFAMAIRLIFLFDAYVTGQKVTPPGVILLIKERGQTFLERKGFVLQGTV